MGDKIKVLPLGLVFKGYDSVSRGYYYYIIQDINVRPHQTYYGHLVTTYIDQATSSIELPSSILLERLVLKRGRNQESLNQSRYPGTYHLKSGKFFLLPKKEFSIFVKSHPNILRQLREEKGIEELVRVPG